MGDDMTWKVWSEYGGYEDGFVSKEGWLCTHWLFTRRNYHSRIRSMYGISIYICVGIYTIHGSYGIQIYSKPHRASMWTGLLVVWRPCYSEPVLIDPLGRAISMKFTTIWLGIFLLHSFPTNKSWHWAHYSQSNFVVVIELDSSF